MKKVNVKFALFFLVISFLWVSEGNSATINAATCSLTDVKAAITSASTKDTVKVPSGNCTWSSKIDIPANKDLAIIGAGIGNTNITCSSSICFSVAQGGSSSASRISGFTFNGGIIYCRGIQGNKEFRLDHNRFVLSSPVAMDICSYTDSIHPTGLVDNNQFENVMIHIFGTCAMWDEGNYQHVIRAQTTTLGDYDDVVYIENNSFSGTGHQNAIDANCSGRYVFRYNTISAPPYVEAHSMQGANRATQRWEIYNNNFSKLQTDWYPLAFIRGGSGVMFGNRATSNYTSDILLDNVRSSRDPGDGVGMCNGTSNLDQNTTGQNGWACRDQIGRMKDETQWSLGSAYAQPLNPAYFWDNIKGSSTQVSVDVNTGDYNAVHIQSNRDYYTYTASFNGTSGVGIGTLANRPGTCTPGVAYWATDQGNWNTKGDDGVLYKCTSPNTWVKYYTPYTYPHPLQGNVGSDLQPMQDLRIGN